MENSRPALRRARDRFNGAATARSRMGVSRVVPLCERVASMGPRPLGRGWARLADVMA